MERQLLIMNAGIKIEIESDVEQPNYSTRENILGFEEEAVCFIKLERSGPVETDKEEHAKDIEEMKVVKVFLTKFDQFTCIVCDRNLDRNRPMRVWKYFEGIVRFLCDDCDRPKGKKFICVKCNYGFSGRRNLIDHVNGAHRKLKKYKCDECDKAYTQVGNLNSHVQSIHRKLKYACQQCKKAFSSRQTLSRHVNFTHRQLNIFTCDLCNKEFQNRSCFKRHIDGVHRKIKEFECAECKRAFFKKRDLTSHVNSVHLQLKTFACDKCNSSFARRLHLRGHRNAVHLKIKYTCAECNKAFSTKSNLTNHMNVFHRHIKLFLCTKCKQSFVKKRYLRKHTAKCRLKNINLLKNSRRQ